MAKLLGVSSLWVYNWEGGKAKPRGKSLSTIIELHGMGSGGVSALGTMTDLLEAP